MTGAPAATRVRPGFLAVLAAACIALQLEGELPLSLLALAIWVAALAQVDRRALRRLWLPKFWLFSFFASFACGALLGRADVELAGLGLSLAGIEAGVLMVVRGAFILSLAAWATRIAGSARLQAALERLGFDGFGRALAGAFGLLPELVSRLRRGVSSYRSAAGGGGRLNLLRDISVEIVVETARLAEEVAAGGRELPGAEAPGVGVFPLLAIVGPPGSGKTTLLLRLSAEARRAGATVRGVVQPALFDGGERAGYRLQDVATGEEHPFARREEGRGEKGLGYSFAPEAWSWAASRIAGGTPASDLLIVDELGRLEARGEGHLPALRAALHQRTATAGLVAVRADCLTQIEAQVGPFARRLEVTEGEATAEAAAAQLRAWLAAADEDPVAVSSTAVRGLP